MSGELRRGPICSPQSISSPLLQRRVVEAIRASASVVGWPLVAEWTPRRLRCREPDRTERVGTFETVGGESCDGSLFVRREGEGASDVLARLGSRLFAPSLEIPGHKFDRSEFISHKLLATQPIVDDRLGAQLVAGSDEQADYLDKQDLIFEIQLGAILSISPVLRRLREGWDLSVDDLLGAVVASPFVEEDDIPFLRAAFARYLVADFVSSMHVLAPRLEQIVRRILRATGVKMTVERDGELRERPLGELVRAGEEAGVIEPAYTKLLQATLCESWGMNLRNDLAHGFIKPEKCNQLNAERLIHIALVLAAMGTPK